MSKAKKRPPQASEPAAPAAAEPTPAEQMLSTFLAGRRASALKAFNEDLEAFRAFLGCSSVADAIARLIGGTQADAQALVLAYRGKLVESAGLSLENRRLATLRSIVHFARNRGLVTWIIRPKLKKPKAVPKPMASPPAPKAASPAPAPPEPWPPQPGDRPGERWLSGKEAQKLLRSPNTGRQPDRAVIRRWALTGRLTMRRIRYGSRSYIEILEHEVRALCRTEGRIERRVQDAEYAEELDQAERKARRQAEASEGLARLGIT